MSLPANTPAKRRQSNNNPPVNHVAISVPDIEAAVQWYTEVLGFRKLRQTVRVCDRNRTPDAGVFSIYPEQLQTVKMAFLTSGNGVGVELFEFVDPPMKPTPVFDFAARGIFHIALTVADPEAFCVQAVARGAQKIGKSIMPWRHLDEDDVALYLHDPWGTVIELMSCSFETYHANRVEN